MIAQLQREIEEARSCGAATVSQRDYSGGEVLLRAMPKTVTSATTNLEDISPPELTTPGDSSCSSVVPPAVHCIQCMILDKPHRNWSMDLDRFV